MTVRQQPEHYSSALRSPITQSSNGDGSSGAVPRSPLPDRTELSRGPSVLSGTTHETFATARESAAGVHYESESEYDDDDRTEQDHYGTYAPGQQQHRHRPSDASTIRGTNTTTIISMPSQQQQQTSGSFVGSHDGNSDEDGTETWEGAVAI
jgi:hypothetical protein